MSQFGIQGARPFCLGFGVMAAVLAGFSSIVAAADHPGAAIYKQQCARCHGAAGEGTKKAPQALVGDRSLPQLTRLVQETMPDSDPGSLTVEQARQVSAYVHDAFYSPDARARANPPRVDLARLTVDQYRNTVADLIGSFRQANKPDPRVGLRGEYFNSRNIGDKRLIDRVDPEVKFDFGTVGPKGGGEFNPNTFGIRWEGSVTAPQTGAYEFVVRTEHAIRLWVNDVRKPLIDAMVKSGNDTEFRGSMHLLAGRSYTIRLEFSKGRNLAARDNKQAAVPTPATVALLWKQPHRPEEVIASRACGATTTTSRRSARCRST